MKNAIHTLLFLFPSLLRGEESSTLGGGNNLFQTALMLGVVFFFFYFILVRPESKKRRELERKKKGIEKGDGVITMGGFLGTVRQIREKTLIIALQGDAEMEIQKGAIIDVQKPEGKK